MHRADDRHVPLQGAANFRDVGGLSAAGGRMVRRGLVFRSDSLARLTDADLKLVGRLGLRTVVDLRTVQERASGRDRLPEGSIRCIHLPMSDPSVPDSRIRMVADLILRGPSTDFDRFLRQQYRAFATHCAGAVGTILRLIADPDNHPVVVHCNAGKDRTGFTTAVLLLCLGVAESDVLAEHVRTNEYLRASIPRYVRALRWLSLGRVSARQVMPLLEARADHLEQVLERIRVSHGSIDAWLERDCGVDPATRSRLAELLLVDDAPAAS